MSQEKADKKEPIKTKGQLVWKEDKSYGFSYVIYKQKKEGE